MNPNGPVQTRHQDYFHLKASREAVARTLREAPCQHPTVSMVVLNLQPGPEQRSEVRIEGRPVPVVPFPFATRSLVDLAVDPCAYPDALDDWLDVYLPRSAFNRTADQHGVDRISKLSLRQGGAVDDQVLSSLGACLAHVVAPLDANTTLVTQIAQAVNVHIAERYGGMRAPPPPPAGGLSPWQLRLARNAFDQHLDGGVSLEQLARDCGLSVGHFSRAFTQSTGLPPHRWLMQRRIEVAKDMMADASLPLAEISLACGFSDQSHFTRAFSKATGVSPGRWRTASRSSRFA